MTTLHGACIGPPNAANVCRDCPGEWVGFDGQRHVCGCAHHGQEVEGNPLQVRRNAVPAWDTRGTSKDGPGRRANAVIPGPRRSTEEID